VTREDRLALLEGGIGERGGTWADLGSGAGAFTTALAELLGPSGRVYSVERDPRALRQQQRELARWAAGSGALPPIELLQADFTAGLSLPALDGALFANSLHFQADACSVIERIARLLKPGGRILVVEYDVQRSGPWIPYPLPSGSFAAIAACAGLQRPEVIASRPSAYHGRAYSAVARRSAQGRSVSGT
jgi:SAM-dependent methyltransferase